MHSGTSHLLQPQLYVGTLSVGMSVQYAAVRLRCSGGLPRSSVSCLLLRLIFTRDFATRSGSRTSLWSIRVPWEARWSALSLPAIPQCDGIHWNTILHSLVCEFMKEYPADSSPSTIILALRSSSQFLHCSMLEHEVGLNSPKAAQIYLIK